MVLYNDKRFRHPGNDRELATTTFGQLDKYVPANDNQPVAKAEHLTGGQYVGLTRHVGDIPGENKRFEGWIGKTYPPGIPQVTVEADWTPPRHGDFMQTYTGRKFWPLDPRPEEVFIEDIAHSLSLQCRYAGHCVRFYSVAEHSVLMARWLLDNVDARTAFHGLLHDAPEAYVVDVPRPLKPFLSNYKEAEAKVWSSIARRYGLAAAMPEAVHKADARIIADELVNLLPMDWHGRHSDGLGVTLEYWTPEEAEVEFLAAFDALSEIVRDSGGAA